MHQTGRKKPLSLVDIETGDQKPIPRCILIGVPAFALAGAATLLHYFFG